VDCGAGKERHALREDSSEAVRRSGRGGGGGGGSVKGRGRGGGWAIGGLMISS